MGLKARLTLSATRSFAQNNIYFGSPPPNKPAS